MSRRHRAEKREVLPDAKFGDLVLTKFMNNLMQDGKKSVAERIVYGAFDKIEQRMRTEPLGVFHSALDNVRPAVEVRHQLEAPERAVEIERGRHLLGDEAHRHEGGPALQLGLFNARVLDPDQSGFQGLAGRRSVFDQTNADQLRDTFDIFPTNVFLVKLSYKFLR